MQCDVTVEELFQAYYDCRRLKRNTWNALRFEENLERNLMDLFHELHDGSYAPGRSMCFVVEHPKVREVWAADFRDRVVHHLLYNRVRERFYNSFIYDSFACIPGKGTLAAAKRVARHVRSITDNNRKPAWFLQADIANYFVSVDKDILDGLLARKITESWWLGLARKILHHDPTKNVFVRSPRKMLDKVPRHKSLFRSNGQGMPIGNLTSQFFANIYLDPLDQFIKHRLKVKKYARYVDDLFCMGGTGAEMRETFIYMRDFAWKHLKIKFHKNKTLINRVEHGINFVGYVIRPWARYIRRSTIGSFYYRTRDPFRCSSDKRLQATVNSYFGMLSHANARKERLRMAGFLRKRFGARFNSETTKMISGGIR